MHKGPHRFRPLDYCNSEKHIADLDVFHEFRYKVAFEMIYILKINWLDHLEILVGNLDY